MKDLTLLEKYRVALNGSGDNWRYGEKGNSHGGAFEIPYGVFTLRVIASNGDGWDHCSVSVAGRCPTWAEMDLVKRLFFKPGETAMQLHVPVVDHINVHPFVLHLWRPHAVPIPMPPKIMV